MHMPTILTGSSLILSASAYVVPSLQASSLVSKRQSSSPMAGALALRGLVSRFAGDANTAANDPSATQCQTSGAKMPQAPTPLPAPGSGLVLLHVTIGRGTQNYTCADSTVDSVPVANGAIATLFEATCMASPYSQMLSALPGIALRFSVPSSNAADALMAGHHFFPDATTPEFDLNTDKHKWGAVKVKKDTAVNAPNAAKDVPWLKLTKKSADGSSVMEVYRVDTAGGVAPANCKGQPAAFQVEYAANYWMYGTPQNAATNSTSY